MLRRSPHSPLRRLCVWAVGVLVPVVTVAGAAWACGPNGTATVTPKRGPAGTSVTVSGEGFHVDDPVEIRWDSASGPILAKTAVSATQSFSEAVTIPDAPPGFHYLVALGRYSDGSVTASATAAFEVTRVASLTLQPDRGPPLSRTVVKGDLFPAGPVDLRWDSPTGSLLATATGPSFSAPVTVPASPLGSHKIVAVGHEGSGAAYETARAFEVTAPTSPRRTDAAAPPLPPRVDSVGPAIIGASLSRANRNRAISPQGYVTLVCGRFVERGVTGTCGARGVRALSAGRLRLRGRGFTAAPGRAVRLRFRLTHKSMKLLKRHRRVRMRGLVVARDGLGNRSEAAFGFTLAAPPKARTARIRSSAALTAW